MRTSSRVTVSPRSQSCRSSAIAIRSGTGAGSCFGAPCEIGSGSSRKTQLLLAALGIHGGRRFVAIDVSEDALRDAGDRLLSSFPWLEFVGVVGDFERHLARIPRSGRRLVAFLGSTIGNLTAEQRSVAQRFWSDLASMGGWRARLGYAWTHLFPSAEYMRARYGIRYSLLLPLYYPYRWLRGLFGWS